MSLIPTLQRAWPFKPPPWVPLRPIGSHWSTTGLVGHWGFRAGAGVTLYDDGPDHLDGVLTGMDPATDWVNSEKGMALRFAAGAQAVRMGTGTSCVGLTAITVLVWAYRTGNNGYIACTSDGANVGWFLRDIAGEATGGITLNPDRSYLGSNIAVPLNEWHQVGLRFDVNSLPEMELIVDGQIVDVAPETGAGVAVDGAYDLLIGNRDDNNRDWLGDIASISVYNRAVFTSELRGLFDQPWIAYQPPSAGLWRYAAAAGIVYYQTLTEAIGVADTRTGQTSRQLGEQVAIADAISKGTSRSLLEAVSTTDQLVRSTARVLAEAIGVTDGLARQTARTLIESPMVTDGVSRVIARALIETISVGDQRIIELARTLSETVAVGDTVAAVSAAIELLLILPQRYSMLTQDGQAWGIEIDSEHDD